MKSIVAIIRQEKYQDVKNALLAVGCEGMNVSEVKGRGSQRGIKESYRGSSYCIDLIPKTRIEIVVKDEGVDTIVEAIKKAYEKSCALKSKDKEGYSYYATVRRNDFRGFDVHNDGSICTDDFYDWTVDDLTADDWRVNE
jgi:nitrogen regulatory protein P-II 1